MAVIPMGAHDDVQPARADATGMPFAFAEIIA